jgi:hypothetical protein
VHILPSWHVTVDQIRLQQKEILGVGVVTILLG